MTNEADIYEGLDQNQRDIVYAVTEMIAWARAFYSESSAQSNGRTALSKLGALATAFRNVYRHFCLVANIGPFSYAAAYRKIDAVLAYLAKKGSASGMIYRRTEVTNGMWSWEPVNAATMVSDILKVYADFQDKFVKKPNPNSQISC